MILSATHIKYYHPQLFEGIERVVSPWSSPWFVWWMLGALMCLVVAVICTPGLLKSRAQMLLGLQKRQSIFSETSITDLRSIVAAVLFTVISFALTLFFWGYNPDNYSQITFFIALAIVASWLVLKMIIISLLCYVFFDFKKLSELLPTIAQTHFFAAIGLFAAVCLKFFMPENLVFLSQIMLIITALAYAIMTVVKIVHHFLSKIIDFLHIFLYLCTIEILPVALIITMFSAIR